MSAGVNRESSPSSAEPPPSGCGLRFGTGHKTDTLPPPCGPHCSPTNSARPTVANFNTDDSDARTDRAGKNCQVIITNMFKDAQEKIEEVNSDLSAKKYKA